MLENNATNPSHRDRLDDMGTSASIAEILVPPLAVLGACYVALLLLWLKTHGDCLARTLLPGRLLKRSSVDIVDQIYTTDTYQDEKIRTKTLLSEDDRKIVNSTRTHINTFKELVRIVVPATVSLAFCPLTLFTHKWIREGLWPPEIHPKAPNINDGIACFLVPAGMVYAISFGFAFQAVFSRNQDVDRCISDEVNRMNRIISLVCRMQSPSPHTRLSVLRTIKEDIIALIQDILGTRKSQSYDVKKEGNTGEKHRLSSSGKVWKDRSFQNFQLEILERTIFPNLSRAGKAVCFSCIFIYSAIQSLERILEKDKETLAVSHEKHAAFPALERWAFLETLGYFNFLAMLLVQTQSYRMDLSMCIVTVISISLLCYIIADLDSPFNGFFRANLNVLPSLVARLDVIYRNNVISMSSDVKKLTES